ncbi:MAG: HAD family hydrolase, partial [Alphaproteobacteria bacterium]|nr:HAD family hydrolase [Alphaproteobacteria bacterium]
NKRGDILRAEADHLGWTGYFGRLVGADDAARDKPDPAPVRLALAAGGLEPGPETWFVGDTGIDMVCGSAAGCTPVLVGDGPDDPAELAHAPPAACFRDLGALRAAATCSG